MQTPSRQDALLRRNWVEFAARFGAGKTTDRTTWQDNLAGQCGRTIRQENQLRKVAAPLVVLEVCLGALASGGCFGIPGAGFGRLNTAASMAPITFCCMISFLSIEMCPTPGTFCTSTFSSAPWNCLLFSTGVP